jgi:diaminopimelate decarboxylase
MKKEDFYEIIPKKEVEQIVKGIELPAFIYFNKIIEKKYTELVNCLPENFEIHYAFKANPNKEVLKAIKSLGMGADVASLGELKLAKETGYSPQKMEFTGPGKTTEELNLAIDLGISSINVESISEIKKIADICKERNKKANLGVRVNPKNKRSASGMKMGSDTQFGIIEDDLEAAFKSFNTEREYITFTGIHMHLGSQFMEADKLIANFRFILEKAQELVDGDQFKIKKINFGGGWGIDMFARRPPLNLMALKEGLRELFADRHHKAFDQDVRFIVEPGRFLVAEAGLYAVEILYRKRGYQREFLVINGGMHQHYAAAGGIGQVIRRNYEADILSEEKNNQGKKAYSIAGCLCIPDDILGTELELPGYVNEGDRLLFFNSGAYGLSASPLKFLSHPLPNEKLI